MAHEIIFHNFPSSPFSEKVRIVFGIKDLTWRESNPNPPAATRTNESIPYLLLLNREALGEAARTGRLALEVTGLDGATERTELGDGLADLYAEFQTSCDTHTRLAEAQ